MREFSERLLGSSAVDAANGDSGMHNDIVTLGRIRDTCHLANSLDPSEFNFSARRYVIAGNPANDLARNS
jgi:hypothetical protein